MGRTTLQDIVDNFQLPELFELQKPYSNSLEDAKRRSIIVFRCIEQNEELEQRKLELELELELELRQRRETRREEIRQKIGVNQI